MGWFSSSSNKDNGNKESYDSNKTTKNGQPELLEDLPPKFEDDVKAAEANRQFEQERQSSTLKEAWHSVKWNDFKNVAQIPCFRQAMLTGGAMTGVVFAVLVSTRSTVTRATNWGMLSFMLGSTISWEQCRFKMRKGLKEAEYAKQHYKNKDKPSGSDGN